MLAPQATVSRATTPSGSKSSSKACPVCHNLDRSKIIYWKGGPSRHKMFKRYYQYSDYHSLPIPLKDLKFSASRECQLCVVVFDVFRWLARVKAQGLSAIYQAKVEICVPFDAKYPLVLTFSWLPAPAAPIPRQYDFQIAVPSHVLPWSNLNIGRQVPSEPKLAIFRARSWLQDCLKNHRDCHHSMSDNGVPRSMPKRLLYIGHHQNQVKLVDDFAGKSVPYLALSYCWGQTQHVVTTKSNYAQQLVNIPWSVLPATYRDAIDLTRAIGYRYLWIDALCIIQGDEQDWNSESSRMAEVYGEAVLVISAVNANHVGFGFFNERPGSRSFKNKLKRDNDDPTHILVQEPTIHGNVLGNPTLEEQWPLFRRAWTLQERMLASRLLHFAAGEMVWECASICACECGHLEATSAVTSRRRYDIASLDSMTVLERANRWDELALSYQNRHITKDKDRLPALSGLANRFRTDELGTYLAGVWSNFAISAMLWEVRKGRKSTDYVAPSWSWAAVQGRLTRNDPIEHNDAFKATVTETHCTPATIDPHGAVVRASGYIQLHSPVHDGTIVRSEQKSHPMIQLTSDLQAFFVSDVPLKEAQYGGTVKCLFVRGLEAAKSGRYIEALVLSLCRDLVNYERIGIAHLRKHDFDHDPDTRRDFDLAFETVTII